MTWKSKPGLHSQKLSFFPPSLCFIALENLSNSSCDTCSTHKLIANDKLSRRENFLFLLKNNEKSLRNPSQLEFRAPTNHDVSLADLPHTSWNGINLDMRSEVSWVSCHLRSKQMMCLTLISLRNSFGLRGRVNELFECYFDGKT